MYLTKQFDLRTHYREVVPPCTCCISYKCTYTVDLWKCTSSIVVQLHTLFVCLSTHTVHCTSPLLSHTYPPTHTHMCTCMHACPHTQDTCMYTNTHTLITAQCTFILQTQCTHCLSPFSCQRNLPAEHKEYLLLFKRLCVAHSALVLLGHMEGEEEEMQG